jgi:uncharacterized membrane protein YoaT (DUF817 family)
MKSIHLKILSILKHRPESSKNKRYLIELFAFGYKQALSCLFPLYIFLLLALSNFIDTNIIFRYDFLLIAFILAQIVLFVLGIESKNELLVITLFHLIGFVLELHKVNVGSWSYPENAITKLGGVPLYAGFMYASVASYICRAWDNFDLTIEHWPKKRYAILIGGTIYLNFFTNAFIPDLRLYIIIVLIFVFRKTVVLFNSNGPIRKMPLLISFVLIGSFLWIAENIATFLGAWKYAYQHASWQMVDFQKLSSWSLLIIVSIIIVAQLKQFKSILEPQRIK